MKLLINISLLIIGLHGCIFAQSWISISEYTNSGVRSLYFDNQHGKLFVGGAFTEIGSIASRGIATYDGSSWSSLEQGIDSIVPHSIHFTNNVLAIEKYFNSIFVGGAFHSAGQYLTKYLANWNGSTWDSVPFTPNEAVYTLKTIGDTLFLGGVFDSINSIQANGVAMIYNNIITPVYNFPKFTFHNQIYTIEKFNNKIYVAGNFEGDSGRKEITFYSGTKWESLGNGVLGASAWVNSMVVFNNQLYIGGNFFTVDGNASNSIMKWNGVQWSDVGGGLNGSAPTVNKLLVIDNELFVFGNFNQAGNLSCSNIAKWNGANWCSLNGQFDNIISTASNSADSFFVGGGFWTIDGDSMYFISKSIISNVDSCGINNIEDVNRDIINLRVFPTPVLNDLIVEFYSKKSFDTQIIIYDALGQICNMEVLHISNGINHIEIDAMKLAVGIYLLKIEDSQMANSIKFVKGGY